jgi:hypothetical protein
VAAAEAPVESAVEGAAESPAEPEPVSPAPLALEELEHSESPPAGLELEELGVLETASDEPVEQIPGLVGLDVDRPEPGDWIVETNEDIVLRSSGGGEFQVPDASEELFARPIEPEPEPVEEPAAPDLVAHAEPHTVVTETMAEVLHQQGHSEDALRVYRELEERGTGDERLRRRIAELEGVSDAEPPPRRFTVAETNGESVSGFFGKLLAAHLPPGPSAPTVQPDPGPAAVESEATAAPTRPAADALSLSSVFGEEPTTLPPAVPAAGAPAPGVSFDEFYGPSGSTSGARSPRADAKNDDLDQFHAWLQNLKR